MKKVKFDNWRDARGSELDKAKRLIKSKKIRLIDISKKLGIPYQSVKGYTRKNSQLNKASWERVNKLSQLEDALYVQENMTSQDVIDFIGYLNILFRDIAETVDDDELPVINRLRDIVISDPLLVTELFKAMKKE